MTIKLKIKPQGEDDGFEYDENGWRINPEDMYRWLVINNEHQDNNDGDAQGKRRERLQRRCRTRYRWNHNSSYQEPSVNITKSSLWWSLCPNWIRRANKDVWRRWYMWKYIRVVLKWFFVAFVYVLLLFVCLFVCILYLMFMLSLCVCWCICYRLFSRILPLSKIVRIVKKCKN